MPTFSYNATTLTGDSVAGTKKAKTESALRESLAADGLTVRGVSEKRSIWQFEITKSKVPPTELMHFSRQLGAFVRAGIPILDAIDIIAMDAGNKTLKEALNAVGEDIRSGLPLSAAATKHPNVFPEFYVRTLRSAELTGKLDSVLTQLSTYIERDEDAKRKIRAAMVYPSIVFGMSIVTVVVLMVFVLPRFRTFFESFDATLPLPTRILLGVGDFVSQWWMVGLAALAGITMLLLASVRTERGRYTRDAILLRLPLVGNIVRYAVIERFCRVLSSLMQAAVAIPEAMEVASSGTSNRVYEKALKQARLEMLEGHGMARPVADTKLFPNAVTQMVRVGEETGTLDQQLQTAAEFFDVELEYKIKKFTTMIEPTVICLMGAIVGFVAISLVMAMYGIFDQVEI
jgi:type IV pilus assembly protein PilC